MIGDPAVSVFAEAYLKDIRGYDAGTVPPSMVTPATACSHLSGGLIVLCWS